MNVIGQKLAALKMGFEVVEYIKLQNLQYGVSKCTNNPIHLS